VRTILWFACAALLSGCAAGAARPGVDVEPRTGHREVDEIEQAMLRIEEELSTSSQAEQSPDCPRVCRLAGNLCGLAGKICAIHHRHPESPDLAHRCRDGARRCNDALTRVKSRCECADLDIPGNPGETPMDP
jgi:hypothetical protein